MYAYNEDSRTYIVYNPPKSAIREKMAAGIYKLSYDGMTGTVSFQNCDSFDMPARVYGNTSKRCDRILQTYQGRPGTNTGVLLVGDAGSGKSLLAKLLCNRFISEFQDGVVIIPSAPYVGSLLEGILDDIKQPCLVFNDEFEKLYDMNDQNKLLTTMDGGVVTGKLFVSTANDLRKVNPHMLDRPSRYFYRYDFHGLEADFITEYASENLNDKTQIPVLLTLSSQLPNFSMDILKSLIEEDNRYGEGILDAASHLNVTVPKVRQDYETWHLSSLIVDDIDLTRFYEVKRVYENIRRLNDSVCLEPIQSMRRVKPEEAVTKSRKHASLPDVVMLGGIGNEPPAQEPAQTPAQNHACLPVLAVECLTASLTSATSDTAVFEGPMRDSGRVFSVKTVWKKGYGSEKARPDKAMDDGQMLSLFLMQARQG